MEFLNIKIIAQQNKHMQVLETLPACFGNDGNDTAQFF